MNIPCIGWTGRTLIAIAADTVLELITPFGMSMLVVMVFPK